MSPAPMPLFGIPEVDKAIQPALPAGWLGLIEGGAGTGSHLLAKQAAHCAATAMPVFYYATHEAAPEVARVFDEYGWDISAVTVADLDQEMFHAQRERDVAVQRARARGLTLSEALTGSVPSVTAPPPSLIGRLLVDVVPLDRPFRLVVDSFDLFLELLAPAEVTMIARQVRQQAYAVGGGALFVLEPNVPDDRTLALLEIVADFILRLDLVEEGNSFYPRIAIRKLRNHPERTRLLRGVVTSRGLEAQF